MKINLLALTALAALPMGAAGADAPPPAAATPPAPVAAPYQSWTVANLAVQAPLGGLKGDAAKGRKLAIASAKGNCLACHKMPIPEQEFHGEIGPDLNGVASRYSEGELRLRIINIQTINPNSLMPPFYKHPDELKQVAAKYKGQTILTAQEVEDVVAYLLTLK